jgi:hypothetical protein
MSMPTRRPTSGPHSLDIETNRDASKGPANIGHLRNDRTPEAVAEGFDVAYVKFAKRHKNGSPQVKLT